MTSSQTLLFGITSYPRHQGIKSHTICGNTKSWEDQEKEPTGSKRKAEPKPRAAPAHGHRGDSPCTRHDKWVNASTRLSPRVPMSQEVKHTSVHRYTCSEHTGAQVGCMCVLMCSVCVCL